MPVAIKNISASKNLARRKNCDRLTHAKNFANELSDSRLREIKQAAANRWTPAARAKKSLEIQTHAPWARSTGPRTDAGRATSARNAWKGKGPDPQTKEILAAIAAQARFLRRLKLARHLVRIHWPDASQMLKDCMETADQITRRMRDALAAAGVDSAMLDARILVRQVAGFSDADMIAGGQAPLSAQSIETIEKMTARRAAGEPVSRILGEREFWGLSFKVTPGTLDPRPDTETLVEAALKIARAAKDSNPPKRLRILDLGTGTGCIPIALLTELPHATAVAVDLNPDALATARENAARHKVDPRIDFRHGSWFDPVAAGESFDLIVSNPPYIPAGDIESLAVDVRAYDPIVALSGGVDGLDAYKIILDGLKKHLACGGRALFEIGAGQEGDVARLAEGAGLRLRDSYCDLAGIIRVLEMSCGEK